VLVPAVFSFMMVFSSVPPAQAQRFAHSSQNSVLRSNLMANSVSTPVGRGVGSLRACNREWDLHRGHWVYSTITAGTGRRPEEQEVGGVAIITGDGLGRRSGCCGSRVTNGVLPGVQWRRGERLVGWSPLPPDEIIVEVARSRVTGCSSEPAEIFACEPVAVYVNPAPVLFRETVVVNRTVLIQNRARRQPRVSRPGSSRLDRPGTHPDL